MKDKIDRGFHDRLNLKFQRLKTSFFSPLLYLLTKMKIGPWCVSNFRIFLAILACILFLFDYINILAVFILLFTDLLDGIDGSLARYQNKASDRGKFVDIVIDDMIYCLLVIMAIKIGANSYSATYNIAVVLFTPLLAIIKKEEGKPTDWIIKPYPRTGYIKYFVMIPFYLSFFFERNWLNQGFFVSNLVSTLLIIYYFTTIQLRWKKQGETIVN